MCEKSALADWKRWKNGFFFSFTDFLRHLIGFDTSFVLVVQVHSFFADYFP
jgi:hypothetical protein